MKKAIFLLAITLLTCNLFAAPAADTTLMTIEIGDTKYAPINVKDAVTGNYLTATISNVTVVNNNPAFATVTATATNSIKAVGVAAGSGAAVVSCQVTYTDPGDGLQKTETKTIVVSYTVTGVAHGAKLSLVFN